jgi:hypothetical protein
MAKETKIAGHVRGYDSDMQTRFQRFSIDKTVTENSQGNVKIPYGSLDINVMPPGLTFARAVMIKTDNDINVTIGGTTANASFDVKGDGLFILTGSLTTIKLSNRGAISATPLATPLANVIYDISG